MSRRILHVIYSFQIGGSEIVVRNLISVLPDFIHGVAAIEMGGVLEQELQNCGAQTWDIGRAGKGFIGPMRKFHGVVREFKPDVIHTHHLHELVYALPSAALLRKPVVHTEHEYYSIQGSKLTLLLKTLSYQCAAVTGVNKEVGDYLQNRVGVSEKKLRTIGNGIDVERFNKAQQIRATLGLSPDQLVIGTVARMDPVKNQRFLLEVFASVLKTYPGTQLLLVGEGSERLPLEEECRRLQITESVQFLGARRDIPELLAAMDVFVLPSKEEGLPISLLEAMASSKAIVSTRVGGIPRLIEDGKTGLLVRSGDHEGLTAALCSLLGSSELRAEFGKNAYAVVSERYSLTRSAELYRQLYGEVARS